MNYNISSFFVARNFKLLSLLAFGALMLIACTEDGDGPAPNPNIPMSIDLAQARLDIAAHVADNFIQPSYITLSRDAAELADVSRSLNPASSDQDLQSANAALRSIWLSWQTAAIYQMGPTESNALRSTLNTYPIDATKIENNIANGSWVLGTVANNGAEGFPALDYLLNGSDASILDDEMRLAYFIDLSDQINQGIQQVQEEWETSTFLINYKSTTSNGTDVGSALGLLVNAIDLHIQRFLRDGKVAIPAGVRSAGVPRPLSVEALHGGYSRDLLVTAIDAYIDLFSGDNSSTGISGPSFVTYLEYIDQEDLGVDIVAALRNSLSLVQALSPDLSNQIEEDNEKMLDLFISLQNAITLIKSDMSSVMGITITNQDNDGD